MSELLTDTFNPRGQPEERDDDELLLLALLLLSDFEDGAERWDRLAPRPYRGLMLARPLGSPDIQPGSFFFDPQRLAYGIQGRGYIQHSNIRAAVRHYTDASSREFSGIAGQVATGVIAIPDWQQLMTGMLKQHHAVGIAVGAGGVESVGAQAWTPDGLIPPLVQTAQPAIAYQLGRLDRFAGQIAKEDATADSVEKVSRRAGTYALPGMVTFEEARRDTARVGHTEERRILGYAEHCDTCVKQADLGWQPIGTLNPIGDSECTIYCKCHFVYR